MQVKVRGSLSSIINKKVKASSRKISNIVVRVWKAEVNKSSASQPARARYTRAIKPYNRRMGAYISDHVAKIIENGFEPFDVKPGLLKGALYKRVPVDGRIRTVSARSSQSSWMHPGVEGIKAVERAKKELELRLEALILEAMR